MLRELSASGSPRRIIATGGGNVGRRQNRKLLAERSPLYREIVDLSLEMEEIACGILESACCHFAAKTLATAFASKASAARP